MILNPTRRKFVSGTVDYKLVVIFRAMGIPLLLLGIYIKWGFKNVHTRIYLI